MKYIIESKLLDGSWVADAVGVENYPRTYGECEADIELLRELADEYGAAEYRINADPTAWICPSCGQGNGGNRAICCQCSSRAD